MLTIRGILASFQTTWDMLVHIQAIWVTIVNIKAIWGTLVSCQTIRGISVNCQTIGGILVNYLNIIHEPPTSPFSVLALTFKNVLKIVSTMWHEWTKSRLTLDTEHNKRTPSLG
jgi:hypothetical protein